MKNKIVKFLFELSVFILLCWGPHAWFTWQWDGLNNTGKILLHGIFTVIALMYMLSRHVKFQNRSSLFIVFLLFLFGSYMTRVGVTTIPLVFLQLFPLYVLMSDNDGVEEHISFISKALSVVLVPGLILHVIFLSGSIFPSIPIQYSDNNTYLYFNYIVNLLPVLHEDTFRFQSIFLEPGYLGTLLAFMLYAVHYNFKKWSVRIMAIALLFSLSLAGFVITIIGYISYTYSNEGSIRRYIPFILSLAFVYYGAQWYNGGDNIVNERIIQRLQYDDEVGIAGNNRFADNTRNNFEYYMDTGEILFGIEGLDETDYAGAGYMRYFLAYGIISAVLFLIMYIKIAQICTNRKYAWGFVALVCITFLQAAYPSSYSWLIPFILGLTYENQVRLAS